MPSSSNPSEASTRAPEWIDTHAHLNDQKFDGRLPEVLDEARRSGLVNILCIGTTAKDSARALTIAQEHRGVFASVGIQPNRASEAQPGDWAQIVKLADDPRVRAIGETGLDRYWDYTPFEQQQEFFDRHLNLARDLGLPVVIHCRLCEQDIVEQLTAFGGPIAGVLHSFSGTWEEAQAFLELGLHISFAGMVTFSSKKLDPLREAAAQVPLDRLLIETDSPYLSPHPFRGKLNSPSRVVLNGTWIAELRQMDPIELAQATTDNARRLFRLAEQETLDGN